MGIKTVTVIGANGTMGCNIAGIFAAFGVFALGLAGLGVMAATLTLIGQVLLGLVAALGTWALIVFIHGYTGTGKKLTLGKPLFK